MCVCMCVMHVHVRVVLPVSSYLSDESVVAFGRPLDNF